MKKFIFILTLLISLSCLSQSSYSFSIPLPPGEIALETVEKKYFGLYTNPELDIKYECIDSGIYSVSTIFSSISRKTIRESSKYEVKNGYLFGLNGTDSIPCVAEDENYYFGIQHREELSGKTSKNVLKRISENKYLLNYEENGNYTPCIIEFNGKKMIVQHFTYSENSSAFDGIENRKESKSTEMNYILLTPTLEEWNTISILEILEEQIILSK